MSLRNIKRKRPEGTYSFDLNANQVEGLIVSLTEMCDDPRLGTYYKTRYTDLAKRHAEAGFQWSPAELPDLISALQSLLHATQTPPPAVVAEVHSTIGIIYQHLNQDSCAIQSFLQALWVQTSCNDVSSITLGLTRTRLALAYGRRGMYNESLNLLEMTLQDFSRGGLHESHELVVRANDALEGFYMAAVNRSQRNENGGVGNHGTRPISKGAA